MKERGKERRLAWGRLGQLGKVVVGEPDTQRGT